MGIELLLLFLTLMSTGLTLFIFLNLKLSRINITKKLFASKSTIKTDFANEVKALANNKYAASKAALPLLTRLLYNWQSKKRTRLFLQQLPDIAGFLSNSLKSGYGLLQALNFVTNEGNPPASQEFRRVLQDINLGKTYEEAFDKLLLRNPSEDLEILVTGILVSRETGGNLTPILDAIAKTLRERDRIVAEVKSLTAQGRLSGMILMLLPVVVFILISITNPAYISPLFTTSLGRIFLTVGILSQGLGSLIIKKIIKIDW